MKTTDKEYKIWKRNYQPFMIGGNVHRNIAVMVKPRSIVKLKHNIHVGIVDHPFKNEEVVFEPISGGIVGYDILEVIKDLADADIKVVKKQIKEAKIGGELAEMVSPEKFFA